jgi:hypothetical protein
MPVASSKLRWWFQKKLLGAVRSFRYTGAPPPFLNEMVEAFASMHPKATREEWAQFARDLAESAWRAGVTSGWERAESSYEDVPSTQTVEEVARSLRVALGEEEPGDAEEGPHVDEAFDANARRKLEWWQARAGVGPRPK